MKLTLRTKTLAVSIITSMLLLSGCGDNKTEAKAVDTKPIAEPENRVAKTETPAQKQVEQATQDAQLVYTKYDSIVYDVFKDAAKIGPENNKKMIVVFGTNTDPYSDRLKADIKNSTDLQNRIKTGFSSYYLKAHENLRHKLYHEGEYMDVDTKTMIAIYGIEATPTLIFTDENGKAVILVPGYMPTKQFLVTMDFMDSGKWKGKNRKNGEVYEVLKAFYVANGIDVTSKKAQ